MVCLCPITVPDIGLLHRLHQITAESDVRLDYCKLGGSPDTAPYRQECTRVLSELQSQHLFKEARLFAAVARVEGDHITVNEVKQDYSFILFTSSAFHGARKIKADCLLCSLCSCCMS